MEIFMKEIIITIVDQEIQDNIVIPYTTIFRYDFEGDESEIINFIKTHPNTLEGGAMKTI